MHIFFGRKSDFVKSYTDLDVECEECGSKNIIYSVNQYYFHIFWIPIFPMDKFVSTYCSDCSNGNENLYSKIGSQLKSITRSPISMYAGFLIFAAFIILIIVISIDNKNTQKDYIEDPKKEDVYCIHFVNDRSRDRYTYIKVVELIGDSICVLNCNITYNENLSALTHGGYFIKDTVIKPKSEIVDMYEKGQIIKVYRDYSDKTGFYIEK